MIAQRGHPQPQGGTGSSHPPGPGRLCTRGCSATFKSNGGIADRRCLLVKCLPGVGYPHSTGLGLGEMRGGGGVGMGFLLKLRKAANISLFFFLFKSNLHLIWARPSSPRPGAGGRQQRQQQVSGALGHAPSSVWPRPLRGHAPKVATPLSALAPGPSVGAGWRPGWARGPPGGNRDRSWAQNRGRA